MSIDSLKFTEANGSIETDAAVAGHLIADLADRPSTEVPPMTAEDLKKAFDYLMTHVMGPRFNDLIDALRATTDSASGADGIGVTAIEGLSGATVQELLESIKAAMDAIVAGAVPDEAITTAKLAPEAVTDDRMSNAAGDILARFAAHASDYSMHVLDAGALSGTSTAYTATVDGFDPNAATLLLVRPNVECGASPTININGGGAKTIKPASAASLSAGQMKQNGVYFLMWLPGATPLMMILNPEPYTVPNALKVGGRTIFVQSGTPSGAVTGDLWVVTS